MDLSNMDKIIKTKVYSRWAELIRRSIIKNFRAGGRPDKWKKSLRVKATGGKTLVDKAHLQNSITVKKQGNSIVAGTSVIYAAAHNFGLLISKQVTVKEHKRRITQAFGIDLSQPVTATVKSHSRNMNLNIPKREFMMLQKEDFRKFEQILIEELSK